MMGVRATPEVRPRTATAESSAPNHYSVRVEEGADRGAPAEGLRVGGNAGIGGCAGLAEHARDTGGGPDRDGRLVDDDRARAQHRRDLACRSVDGGVVYRTVGALECRDAQEQELSFRGGRCRADDERRRLAFRPSATKPGRSCSRISTSASRSLATLCSSISPHTTS